MSGSARGMNFKAPGRPHDIQKVATLSGGLALNNGVPIQVNKNAKSYAVASRRCTMHLRFHGRLMAWRCDKLQRYGTTRYYPLLSCWDGTMPFGCWKPGD